MSNQAKLALSFVIISPFALVMGYAFLSGLTSGEIGCFGRGCRGTASLVARPVAYLVYMGIAGLSAAFMGSLAVYFFAKLLQGKRGAT